MILLGLGILNTFKKKHTDAISWIDCWVADVKSANWQTTQDIKKNYSSASFLPKNVVIFNVKGNNYRLEVKTSLEAKTILVLWCGTHAEYDKRNKVR